MFFKNNILGILWAVIILILTVLPGNYFPQISSFWELLSLDKLIHVSIFAVFSLLLIRGFKKQNKYLFLLSNYKASGLFVGIIYGSLTEIIQYILNNGRHYSLYDFLANSIGCIVGLVLFNLFLMKYFKNV